MSDQFWVGLFTLLTMLVSTIGGVLMVMVKSMGKRMEAQVLAQAEIAKLDREAVICKVDAVEARVSKAAVNLDEIHKDNAEFQNIMLASDIFDGSKLREFAQKRRSGFGPLDP
jgi:uncharacterized iron-regulated membrane protein